METKESKIPTYIKIVDDRELCFTKITQDIISPKIISITKDKRTNKNAVIMEKYPIILLEYYDEWKYKDKIKHLINTLHKIEIIHGDLHANNIVINPENKQVKLIDFGKSFMFKELDKDKLKELNEFLEPDTKFKNINDIIKFEHTMYERDL